MKKFIAIALITIMAVMAMIPASAASDNNPLNFDTKEAVLKWKTLDEDCFEAGAGKDGTGALKITGDKFSGVKIIPLENSVDIKAGSNVTISFETKSNVALSEGLKGGGKRVIVRLGNNDNTRTSNAIPADNTWVSTSVRYVGNEAGGRDATKNNVDQDYKLIEIVAFNLTAGDEVYIDNIKITDDSGKTYLLDTMLDAVPTDGTTAGEGAANPGTADPITLITVAALCVIPTVTVVATKKKNR